MVASLTLASRVARSINMKVINVILLLCCLCSWQEARAGTCTTILPQLSTLSVGTINVQRDAPVGTVIFSGA